MGFIHHVSSKGYPKLAAWRDTPRRQFGTHGDVIVGIVNSPSTHTVTLRLRRKELEPLPVFPVQLLDNQSNPVYYLNSKDAVKAVDQLIPSHTIQELHRSRVSERNRGESTKLPGSRFPIHT